MAGLAVARVAGAALRPTDLIAGVAPGEYKIYSWDQIETGAYQNAEWLKQYELKGRAVVAKQDGHETVALRAIQ